MDLAAQTPHMVSQSAKESAQKADALLLPPNYAFTHESLGKILAVQTLSKGLYPSETTGPLK